MEHHGVCQPWVCLQNQEEHYLKWWNLPWKYCLQHQGTSTRTMNCCLRFDMLWRTALPNLNVVEKVCEDLDVENVPAQLLCNVHPLKLFQRKTKEMCQQIHDELGKQKLWLFHGRYWLSVVVKAIKCLTNFINRDFSAKPWNRSSHFEEFIKPKKNMSLSLKDDRFNRLQDCATAVLHHIEDISKYLIKYPNVTNGIAILDRSFVEMEILKPILATISLLGIHITHPFHALLTDSETSKYSTLMVAFKTLYENLTEIPPEDYLNMTCCNICIKGNVWTFTTR